MDVSAYLKRGSAGGKTVRQIAFKGERVHRAAAAGFSRLDTDTMAVNYWAHP
jgi:hypothetical protein